VTLGFHRVRSFWRIVDLDDCLLLPEPMAEVLRQARTLARRLGLVAYDARSHQGWARRLVVRASQATGQVLALFITAPGQREVAEQFAQGLREACPFLTTIYWGASSHVADVTLLEDLTLLYGPPHLEERIGPFTLQVHPLNFLQPNTAQAARIYATLQSWVSVAPGGMAWDLYCGIGLVSFYLAKRFRALHGIDLEASHTAMAPLNAARSGIANFTFHEGKAEEVLANKRFWLQEAKPDLIVVDPPRAGLHPRVTSAVLSARPQQIAYLSCNVNTLGRDLKPLMKHFPSYRLSRVQGFDMFPHTPHLEALVLLDRRR
jgi:23S rRNA (uracil1939-C5)-methyltransferase